MYLDAFVLNSFDIIVVRCAASNSKFLEEQIGWEVSKRSRRMAWKKRSFKNGTACLFVALFAGFVVDM